MQVKCTVAYLIITTVGAADPCAKPSIEQLGKNSYWHPGDILFL